MGFAKEDHINSVQVVKPSISLCIDFGTHGTGFCWTNDDGKTLHSLESWPSAPTSYPKDLTAILYQDQTPIGIGYAARELFASTKNLSSEGNLRLVRHFKLLLDNPEHPCKDSLPTGLTLETVLSDYLTLLLKQIKSQLKQDLPSFSMSDIRWILTVPAMLSMKAKNTLGEAAIKAGLVERGRGEENLMLLHEPEAAAIFAQVKVKDPRFSHYSPLLADRDVFMVLDAGGGTTDITIHKCVKSEGGTVRMEEATWADGAALGSTQLDAEFLSFFRGEVGEEAYDSWSKTPIGAQELLMVLGQWESLKCDLGRGREDSAPKGPNLKNWLMSKARFQASAEDEEDNEEDSRITVPPSLHALMTKEDKSRLDVEYGGSDSISVSESIIKKFFDPTIDQIVALAKKQINKASELTSGISVSKILLVGGLCSSSYVQSRLMDGIKGDGAPKVLVLDTPYAAVMQGGAIFGSDLSIIRARRMRYTYGVMIASPYREGDPIEKKFWHDEYDMFFTSHVLLTFVAQGQLIEVDQVVKHSILPLHTDQEEVSIIVYLVDGKPKRILNTNELLTTRKLATMTVFTDPSKPLGKRCVSVTFCFGKTEVTASAHEASTSNKVETSFRFASD